MQLYVESDYLHTRGQQASPVLLLFASQTSCLLGWAQILTYRCVFKRKRSCHTYEEQESPKSKTTLKLIKSHNVELKDNSKINLALKAQLAWKKLSTIDKRRKISTHSNAPLKFLSINNERKLVEGAWNYSSCNLSILDSLLFLYMQSVRCVYFLNFDSLHLTCF